MRLKTLKRLISAVENDQFTWLSFSMNGSLNVLQEAFPRDSQITVSRPFYFQVFTDMLISQSTLSQQKMTNHSFMVKIWQIMVSPPQNSNGYFLFDFLSHAKSRFHVQKIANHGFTGSGTWPGAFFKAYVNLCLDFELKSRNWDFQRNYQLFNVKCHIGYLWWCKMMTRAQSYKT